MGKALQKRTHIDTDVVDKAMKIICRQHILRVLVAAGLDLDTMWLAGESLLWL